MFRCFSSQKVFFIREKKRTQAWLGDPMTSTRHVRSRYAGCWLSCYSWPHVFSDLSHAACACKAFVPNFSIQPAIRMVSC